MIRNWNNLARKAEVRSFETQTGSDRVPRGSGRNYGDAALGSQVTDMRMNRSEMRIEKASLVADSGFLLREIIVFCAKNGFHFPVIPGTQFVTLGGMLASDVHGKDHASKGCIGRWVQQLTVRLSDGTVVVCSQEVETSLFRLTIGGMGSTGAILQAVITLEPIQGTGLEVNATAFSSFEDMLVAWEQQQERYVVAWADGFRQDRYVLSSASWIGKKSPMHLKMKGAKLTVPQIGLRFVHPFLMRWYNNRYFKKALKKAVFVEPEAFFFPLDQIGYWNRLYGRKGLIQHQFILPKETAASTWKMIADRFQQQGFNAFLIVIKHHGALTSPGYLSFPMEGFSFALDFPRTERLEFLIQQLNQAIIAAGGRIYLAKDDVLKADDFYRMYPIAEQFREEINQMKAPPIRSLLGDRLKFYEIKVSSLAMQQTVFIIGANSDVGLKCAEAYRLSGSKVVLFGHKTDQLPQEFETHFLNVARPDLSVFEGKHADIVLFTAGRLPENEAAFSGEALQETIAVNFTGQAEIASYFARRFQTTGKGVIVGVSSVAAVRGKGSNVLYGAAKAGWDTYLSGLRNYLHPTGVRVLTIRPGYIATKMTHGMKLPHSLTATSEKVAGVIVRHSLKGKRTIVYVKPAWRFIAFVVKHIPEAIVKKLKW